MSEEKALVLLSGGQDSTTALYWALQSFGTVEAVSFDYGQRHVCELDAARAIAAAAGVAWHLIEAGNLSLLSRSALLAGQEGPTGTAHPDHENLPASFVPFRNLNFLLLGAAWSHLRGFRHLVLGVGEADYSGYPDCRDDFVKAAQVALNLALGSPRTGLVLHTPLMWLDKAAIFGLARDLGVLDRVLTETRTCYLGGDAVHEWGRGCGECPACLLRRDGYRRFREQL